MDSVDSALRYLQRQFASVAHEEKAWNEERMQLQQRVRELESERSVQEEAYKEAMLRVKMLEFALRQERGRYLVSPAPVITASTSNLPATKPRTESAEVSRGITISRSMERSKSAHSAHSPSPSPGSSPKSIHIYRADSVNTKKAGVKTPSAKSGPSKGTEITRPRIPSRSASAHEDVSDSAKATKPVVIPMGPKGSYKPHKLKLKLAGHMDGVRSLAFHPTEPIIVSGSEDCTVRVWNLASLATGPPSQRVTEVDSYLTYRTHLDCVLAVAVISADNSPNTVPGSAGMFASSGRDGSICLFKLPPIEGEKGSDPITYEDYQGLKSHMIKRAHEDAVWDLHAHPLSNVLFSSGADGVVRTWGVSSELSLKSELRCSTKASPRATGHNYRGYLTPTCAHTMLTDAKTCVVGYTNGAVAQFDFHGEQLIHVAKAIDVDPVGREGQVNKVVVHPTMPIAIAAHNDKKIRMYDMRAGECIGSLTAHQDSVASLSIDSAGLYLASGGHDGSLRVWSVADRHCIFEQAAHRPKMGEAVHTVAYHQSRNFIATGGADGTVKVFQ